MASVAAAVSTAGEESLSSSLDVSELGLTRTSSDLGMEIGANDDEDSCDGNNLVIDTTAQSSSIFKTPKKHHNNGTVTPPGSSQLVELTPNQENWIEISGGPLKPLTREEYDRYLVPFELGWKREVVLRSAPTGTGRRIGDIYYFSADRKVKLRSNSDTTTYFKSLKDPNNVLSPLNFCFIRQPIYKTPDETVRNAMSRISDQSAAHVSAASTDSNLPLSTTNDANNKTDLVTNNGSNDASSLAEGRGKRRRVAPKRFEDEEDDIIPVKKKSTPKLDATKPKETLSRQHQLLLSLAAQEQESNSTPPSEPQKQQKVVVVKNPNGGPKLIRTPVGAPSPAAISAANQLTAEHNRKIQATKPTNAGASRSAKSNKLPKLAKKFKQPTTVKQEVPPLAADVQSIQSLSSDKSDCDQTPSGSQISNQIDSRPQSPAAGTAEVPTRPLSRQGSNSSLCDLKGENFALDHAFNESCDISEDEAPPLTKSSSPKLRQKIPTPIQQDIHLNEAAQDKAQPAPQPPCTVQCPNRRGMMPNLLCCRCLCFYHLDCVPTGIFLENPIRFLCPTCKQDSDLVVPEPPQPPTEFSLPVPQVILEHQPIVHPSCGPLASNPTQPQSPPHQHFSALTNGNNHYNHNSSNNNRLTVKRIKQHHKGNRLSAQIPIQDDRPLSLNDRSDRLLQRFQSLAANKLSILTDPKSSTSLIRPIAPIGPPQFTSDKLANILGLHHQMVTEPNKFHNWLRRQERSFDSLTDHTRVTQCILSHITAVDLLSLRLVNKKFNLLCSLSSLWKDIKFRRVHISDWQYAGEKIIERYQAEAVSFEGISTYPLSPKMFWRDFLHALPFMHSVRSIRFGTVPSFVIQDIISNAEHGYLSSLKELYVRNVIDANEPAESPGLEFLQNMSQLRYLERLVIGSLRDLSLDCPPDDEDLNHQASDEDLDDGDRHYRICSMLSTNLSRMTSLRHLTLTSLESDDPSKFQFISSLGHLESLELGSCLSWSNDPDWIFPLLGLLTRLRFLSLSGLLLKNEAIDPLTEALSNLTRLESLTLDKFAISFGAGERAADFLANLHPRILPGLKRLSLFTDGPVSNVTILSSLPALNGLAHICWRVGCFVNDSGECFAVIGDLSTATAPNKSTELQPRAIAKPFLVIERELKRKLDRTNLKVVPF